MKRGFTLLEIMIVVGIVSLLTTTSIHNLLRARVQANESTAQAALRSISTAQVAYKSGMAIYGTLQELGSPGSGPAFIDGILATGTKNGYAFSINDITEETFHARAMPAIAHITGVRSFCINEDGVIRIQAAGGNIADRAACLDLPPTQQ